MNTELPSMAGHRWHAEQYAREQKAQQQRRWVIGSVAVLTTVMAIALFLADGGLARFTSIASAFTAVGVIAGLVATNGLFLSLMLSARIPFVDRTIGQPEALTWHNRLGSWVVVGLAIHASYLLAGYALTFDVGIIGQFSQWWHDTADFGWAVAGMIGFLVIAVSSIVAARRVLPYEAWYVIHLVSYVAVAASIPHQFSMSGLFHQGPQRWYWIALSATTGGLLVGYRFVKPLLVNLRHELRVDRVELIAADAVNIYITGRNLDQLDAAAGQYGNWRFLQPGLWWHQHPFSLSAAPNGQFLRITVRKLGRGSAALFGLRVGTRVLMAGPYGNFTDAARTREAVVLIGSGVGIAPIRALAEATAMTPGKAAVVLRASNPEELYLVEELRTLCTGRGAQLVTITGPRAGCRWVSQQTADLTLTRIAPYLAEADLYICGPGGCTDSIIAEARAAGVPATQIHEERFAW